MAFKFNPLTSAFDLVGITTSPPGTVATVEKFTLTGTDITNKYITLSSSPATAGNTVLLVADAPNLFYDTDFTITGGNQLSWNGLALDGILSSGDSLTVMYIV